MYPNNNRRNSRLDGRIKLEEITRKYEINVANIVKIIHYACLKTIEKNQTPQAIPTSRKEFRKSIWTKGKW